MRALPWLVPVAGKQACSLGIELIQMMPISDGGRYLH